MSVKKTLPGHCVDSVPMGIMAFPIVSHVNVHLNQAHSPLLHATKKLAIVSVKSALLVLRVNSVILATSTILPVKLARAVIPVPMRPFVMLIRLCWSVSALNDLLATNVANVQLVITHFPLVPSVPARHPARKWKMASTWRVTRPAVNVCASPNILALPVMSVPMASL